jgi:hypothetical protein
MKSFYARTCIGLVCLIWASLLGAQPVPEISPSDTLQGAAQDAFFGDVYGDHVAVSEDWVFVAAPREVSARGESDGAVYVYERGKRGKLEFHQKLEGEGNAAPGSGGDRLGAGLAVADEWLFVTAGNDQFFSGLNDPRSGIFDPNDPDFVFAGKVYVYRLMKGNWTKVQELTSPVPGSLGGFGGRTNASHVALNEEGTLAVIGESGCCGFVLAAHVFGLDEERRTANWNFRQTIEPPAADGVSQFADEVLPLGEDHFLIGAETFNSVDQTVLGRVYLYEPEGDGLNAVAVQRIDAPGGAVLEADCFGLNFGGTGMAAANGTVVIADSCANSRAGVLHVYDFNSDPNPWLTPQAVIPHPDGTPDDQLGSQFAGGRQAVDTDGTRIVAGTPLGGMGGAFGVEGGGDTFVFDRSGKRWRLAARLKSAIPLDDRLWFGHSATILNDELVGVGEMDSFGLSGGKLFLYEVD